MKSTARALVAFLTALAPALTVYAQMGGGGIGAGSLGLRTTGESRGIEAVTAEEAIPGRWRIEFRIRRLSEDPQASGVWRTVMADMALTADRVTGWIRDDDYQGDFNCTIDTYGRCIDGRLRFFTDEHDWQEFSFILDRDGYRAEGWAVFADLQSGAIHEYELMFRKR